MLKFPTDFTSKFVIILILIITALIVVDSSIVKFVAYSNYELPTPVYVGIFIAFSSMFVGIMYAILRFIYFKPHDSGSIRGMTMKSYHLTITLTQYSLIGILGITILQILLFKSYNIFSLLSAIYVSHVISVLFLFFLIIKIVDWIMTRKNRVLSLYAMALTLMAFAIMTSLIYATFTLGNHFSSIKQFPIRVFLYSLPGSELANSFATAIDLISLSSFILLWVATAMLFKTYRRKMGKIKYWVIMVIPLVYFLFPFETYFPNKFIAFDLSMILSGVIKVSFFSATKQIGALLFSLTFWVSATLISKNQIQRYVLISAVGMAMLFSSIEIDSLLYAVYPPFGLITILFMPLGAYMLFTGISLSSIHIARDKDLRKEFYKTALSQLELLKIIGVTQMENEIMKAHKSINKAKNSLKTNEPNLSKDHVRQALDEMLNEMDSDRVREILHDVLTDVYSNAKRGPDKA